MATHNVFLCIGGNLGDRMDNLEETRTFIEFNMGDLIVVSPVYESEAWEMKNAPAFLNQVVLIQTELSPNELLVEIAELEAFYGRKRSSGMYVSREMDVDVLFFDELVLDEEKIQIPHPRMHLRKFVLLPLSQIAPEFVHPGLGKTIIALLADCPDQTSVIPYVGV